MEESGGETCSGENEKTVSCYEGECTSPGNPSLSVNIRDIKWEHITFSYSECNSIILVIETDGIECCRENGVPEYCFGYCLKETKETKSRAITGACEEWLKQIGQCNKGLSVFTSIN